LVGLPLSKALIVSAGRNTLDPSVSLLEIVGAAIATMCSTAVLVLVCPSASCSVTVAVSENAPLVVGVNVRPL